MPDPIFAMIVPLSGSAGHPDQGLPGGPPARPDQGLPPGAPVYPDQGPPASGGHPWLPGHGGVPPMPPELNPPPPAIWPGVPIHPIAPDSVELPDLPPGTIWPPLPPSVHGQALVLCWVVGVGYRWVLIDTGARPDQGLPDTPQPK